MREDAPQREHSLRDLFNAARWVARAGIAWRMMPHDLPPWAAVYQQTQRWFKAGVFGAMVSDLRLLLRVGQGRNPQPSATILDSRTLQSTPESGGRAGYYGATRKRGSKVHLAVDTLGHLLALVVTPADEQDRAQVAQLAQQVQRKRAKRSRSPLSIRATPAKSPLRRLPSTAFNWRWSSYPRRRKALCSCLVAGSSSAVSPGWHGFDVWPVTTSDSPPPWPASISSPLPSS